jgi:hypothetical protein
MKTIVKCEAADPKAGMTFRELNEFLDEVAEVAGWTGEGVGPIRTTVNMRGGIKKLSVEVVTDD